MRALPPELLRKGRFDEVFWVDLPTQLERAAIARAAVKERGRTISDADAARIAEATRAFTGSEIAAVVPDAMFQAFAEGREVNTDDIVAACAAVVPLSKTAADKIADLRQWAKGRARPASVQAVSDSTARQLDIG
ncbi:MAG: hypothetical protein FJ265_21585 [Planctomycetes bacterium]|nr:hypothetical protein [Planctomycetota bacterium]